MSLSNGEIYINEKKLNKMKLSIIRSEQKNLKTREKSDSEMVDLIRRIISDEVKKNY
ncbi:hypothetical protein [Sutcliffiella cohnii]|uniref:hypothetical protein n=1 Tax=Sutcliffiella cohnii TaxID=33932 RepID=UPI002E1A6C3C|nr:hypothetical protein [Sutcliffiella cohnii]